jgi:hypothetical protein
LSCDAHWFRLALAFAPERPSLNRLTRTFVNVNYPLTDFSRLQGLDQALSPGWEPGHSLGFFPFSAITISTRRMKLPSQTLPAPRFSQPLSRFLGANHGLSVYSTRLALVGSGPSEPYLRTIENCFQPPCFYAVTCLTWFPSVFRFALPLATPQRTIHTRDDFGKWPTDSR